MHFQPPAPDGDAYTHLYWLAAKDTDENPSGRGATTPRLRALFDLKAKLRTEICKSYRPGSTKTQGITTTGRTLDLWSINKPQMLSGTRVISNSTKSVMLWGTTLVQFLIKNTPTGTPSLPMQTAPSVLKWNHLHESTDSALHILSGCQHTKMRNMIIKRHNTASMLIVQTLQRDHAVPTKLPTLM